MSDELCRELKETQVAVGKDLLQRLGSDEEVFREILEWAGPAYMKPTTATTDESMLKDAERDARFLAHAADAVLAEFKKRFRNEPVA